MFKYVWIIILVLVSVFGWAYSICNIVLTIRAKEDNDDLFDILSGLEEFTLIWITLYTIIVFIVSLILYAIAKMKGA